MEVSRRSFLKRGLLLGGGAASGLAGAAAHAAGGSKKPYKLTSVNETTNICCYCSGGCGTICSTRNGELINLEGDPDHPVNLGGLCPKGAAMWGLRNIVTKDRRAQLHPDRVLYPMVRRPGSKTWERLSWDQAALEIARHVKKTRDATFVEKEGDVTVNRCDGIASLGAAQLNNEEGWLVQKFARSLGVLAIDNQTRVCHSSTVSGLAPSFGRGSMTSHWCDFANSDVIMSIGSNNVENHPLSSRWVERAQDKGATWIVVDPRYSRSAARADIYARIRPGSDLAFYGGLINYILQNDLFQKEYVLHYTNAACLLRPDFKFDVDHGLFSGWDPETKRYDNETWGYDVEHKAVWDTSEGSAFAWVNRPGTPKFKTPDLKVLKRDMTLQDPNCVLNVMKRHYARYTPELVTRVTGMDPDVMKKVWEVFASTGRPDKAGSILYALGQTQHTYGSQNCRAMCVIQLLLGNIGIAGGGINALRGEPNVQGSTDVGASSHQAPAYLSWPTGQAHPKLADYLSKETYAAGYYANKPKFWISQLREWFGANATVENDYCYDLLPKISPKLDYGDYSTIMSFNDMRDNKIKGYFCWGMNPMHSTPNGKHARHSMANLDWLVVADWFQTETSTFWEAPDMKPEDVKTEVYFLPAALIYEKIGSINNSGRWIQWREKAIEPPGECRSDFEMMMLLWKNIVELYKKEGGACPDQILKTNFDYTIDGKPDLRALCWALNGYTVGDGKLLKGYGQLQADGTTACGMWIFSGYYNNESQKLDPMKQPMTNRSKEDPTGLGLFPGWSFAWPANRRILYNRCSADPKGKPWDPKRVLVEWDGKKWLQNDVGDFVTAKAPDDNAFFMTWEQNARLFAYSMADGPLPEHFEPHEAPVKNLLNGAGGNPCARFTEDPSVRRGSIKDYPYVVTTYSVVEHWQSGTQTRNIPWLNELIPSNFIELSEELAKEKGMTVVVLDHHEPGFRGEGEERRDILPAADAIIDPKQRACPYPFKQMCAGGLSYYFAHHLLQIFEITDEGLERQLLTFAGIATVCDIVDLLGENRALVQMGLAEIGKTENIGLRVLIEEAGLSDKAISEYHIGFIIGPCINATGRLESGRLAVELFCTQNEKEAREKARHLVMLNAERKQLTEEAAERADIALQEGDALQDRVLVLYDAEIHESIAGIVAGRIKDKYYRPTILITGSEDGAKGSGRSIEGYHLFEALFADRDLFTRFGGHAMAAGLSLPVENIPVLRRRLNEGCTLTEEQMIPILRLEDALSFAEIDLGLAKELQTLAPFGKGNPAPLFASKGIHADRVDLIGKNKDILRLTLSEPENGIRLSAISFDGYEPLREMLKALYPAEDCDKIINSGLLPQLLDIVYSIEINSYRGRSNVQLILKDFRFAK